MPDQRSLLDQLRDVARLADVHGHYDAADWIRNAVPALKDNPPSTARPTQAEVDGISGSAYTHKPPGTAREATDG